MIGIFSRFSGYIPKPHHHHSHKLMKLEQVSEEEEEECEEDGSRGSDDAHGVVLEREEEDAGGEFKPIRHRLEPLDDDRPAEYPLPFSYLVNDGGELSDSFAKSLRKMAAEPKLENEGGVATQTPRRRSHSLPPSNHNIFQVFHQCKQTV